MRLKRFIALSLHSVFAICDAALRRQNRMRRGECLASRYAPFPADNFLALPGRHAPGLEHAGRVRRLEIVEEGLGGRRILAVGGDGADENQLLLQLAGEGADEFDAWR
jgi:hypothetical protein